MIIVKFCKRAHNPFLAETKIQLCTASYYKSIDNDFIRDADEGQVSRTYHPSKPAVYTDSEIGKMTGLPISGAGSIRFEGKAVRTTNPIPIAYLFCTSYLERPTLSDAASLGYDSFYVVKDPNLLCERIALEMQRLITGRSEVLAFHGRVSYQNDKEVIFSHLPAFFQSHKIIQPYLYLLKRRTSRENPLKVYANEHEYRFVFVPMGEHGRPIRLTAERIYFDLGSINDILDQKNSITTDCN